MSSENIAQFCAITGADTRQAEGYLSLSADNVEQAISLYFEGGDLDLDHQESTRQDSVPVDDEEYVRRIQEQEYQSGGGQEEVRERIAPVTERLVEPGYDYDYDALRGRDPFQSMSSSAGVFNQRIPSQTIRARGRGFQIDEDSDDEYHDAMDQDDDDNIIYGDQHEDSDMEDETSTLTAHQSRLANLFRPPFDLIRSLRLESAKEEAILEQKWLLVNIQDSREFQCQILNRDLWSNQDVKQIVKSNFLFLQYPHDSSAGLEYIQYYPFEDYPHISILDPRTGEQLKTWNKSISPTEWLVEVQDFLDKFSLDPAARNPVTNIAKRNKQVSHMTEEEQIQLAMKQSLGNSSDDEVVEVNPPAATSSTSASESRLNATTDGNQFGSSNKPISIDEDDWDSLTEEEKFATILPKDDTEPSDVRTTTRIQIRLGNGKRIIRRFNLDDKVSVIFAFLKATVPEVDGHYFTLVTSDRKPLIEMIQQTIAASKLQNSAIMLEIQD